MSWFSTLIGFLGGSTIGKTLDIALERTEDVDKRNALLMEYMKMKEETERARFAVVTVPWVDAFHKISRPLLGLVAIVGVFTCAVLQIDLAPYAEYLAGAAGLSGLYIMAKGKGR